jgi:NADPH:quinone reductase-like Zn-dependent oxidoreductase
MKRIVVNAYGSADVLEVQDVAARRPGIGQVTVKVGACGVNFADLLMRAGMYPQCPTPPFTPGNEIAGVVAEAGPGVEHLPYAKPGTRVFASIQGGGYAESVILDAGRLWPIPASLTDAQACTLSVNYLTAWIAIRHLANLRADETIVIDSAGGAVGLAALQIVAASNARAIGLASRRKHDRLAELGFALCLDPVHDDIRAKLLKCTGGRGVDAFLDATGGTAATRAYSCLAPLGRLICFGTAEIAKDAQGDADGYQRWQGAKRFAPYELMMHNRSVSGLNLASLWADARTCVKGLLEIIRLVETGILAPAVDRIFPLTEAIAAHRYIHERRNFGKVVLQP